MIKRHKTKREIQAEKTRDTIIRATNRLVAAYGFEHIRVADICKEAGVAIGTFYNHFKSKDYVLLIGYDFDRNMREILSHNSLHGTAKEKILRLFELEMNYVVNSGVLVMKTLFEQHLNSIEDGNKAFFDLQRIMPAELRSILAAGVANGEIKRDRSVEQYVEDLLILSRGLTYNWCIKNGNDDLAAHTRRLMNDYLEGILRRP